MSDKEARKLEAIQMYQNMGCSKAKRNQLQVYRYSHVGSSAAQLSARYLFDKSHQPNKKTSEIHHLNMIHMKINITRKFIDSDDVTRNSLDKDWQYLGAIKESKLSVSVMIALRNQIGLRELSDHCLTVLLCGRFQYLSKI